MREYVEKVASPKAKTTKLKVPAGAKNMGGTASNIAGGEGDTKGIRQSQGRLQET